MGDPSCHDFHTNAHCRSISSPSVFSSISSSFSACYLKKRLAHRRTPRAPTSLSPRNSRLAKQANKFLLKEKNLSTKTKQEGLYGFRFFVWLYFCILFLALLCQIARFIMKSLRAEDDLIRFLRQEMLSASWVRFFFFNETRV